ncbi:hypothetical protein [Mycobacterium marinum]|uniref:hypothetical protein n=1 Tax=Mycobacterium marinum TaxID=1781 RepID=UPI002358E0AD|nr:hypothetical protein [Mycobacterium marinum]MDC8981242.1 hypothetical protein [Mycobacterium marinum]
MNAWYHVVCAHKGEHSQCDPVHVCDIEDDGGGQAAGHDRLTELRDRIGISRPGRDIGRRLRAFNRTSTEHWLRAPGVNPETDHVKTAMEIAFRQGRAKRWQLACVDIAQARKGRGHEWRFFCGVCAETIEISDARLLAALNRLRSQPNRDTRAITVDEQRETFSDEWITTVVTATVVLLSEIQKEINR